MRYSRKIHISHALYAAMKGAGGELNVDFMVENLPALGFEPATFGLLQEKYFYFKQKN